MENILTTTKEAVNVLNNRICLPESLEDWTDPSIDSVSIICDDSVVALSYL